KGMVQYRSISPWFYLPGETVFADDEKESGTKKMYQKWQNQGLLEVHDGAENNFKLIAQDLIADAGRVPLSEVPHDEW
ncbi:hypothetical protein K4H02_28030, partial [Mycobacterium tuberculosis]|nr:hypothetical protein [Mycobacterium tuberculosis]